MSLGERWLKGAYTGSPWLWPLAPLGALYARIMQARARAYADGRKPRTTLSVPVIVVGNITLGGTGKSPLVAWLVRWLAARGYTPGIVTRGYGGTAPNYPLTVTPQTPTTQSGDEPVMLAQQTGVPVVADPERGRGAKALVAMGCDIVVSDDGLQHLALDRDIELVVIDGARGLGNRRCLPAGPLRESASRLATVDRVIVNGDDAFKEFDKALNKAPQATTMRLRPIGWRRLADGERLPLAPLPFALPVHGVAGIGNPGRFFATLEALGVQGQWHAFADHHTFGAEDLHFAEPRPIVMTAKDAVKCHNAAPADSWALDVEAVLPPEFEEWLATRLSALA